MAGKFLSIQEIADWLGVDRSTVSRILARGEIPSLQIGDMPRVDPADLTAWIDAGKAASLKRAAERQAAAPAKRAVGRPRKPALPEKKLAAVAAADA